MSKLKHGTTEYWMDWYWNRGGRAKVLARKSPKEQLRLKRLEMGTNFFAHIIPSKRRKNELLKAIEKDDFSLVKKLTSEMYGDIELDIDSSTLTGGIVHLGKMSGGWKFLWNPNIYLVRNGHSEWIEHSDGSKSSKWVPEPDTAYYLYPLTKKGIKAFINRKDVEIYDEYGEKQDKKTFWKEALEWTTWRGKEAWDSASYEKAHPESLRYALHNDYIDLLEKEGFKFTSSGNSDFYSDGLRFATTTEFG